MSLRLNTLAIGAAVLAAGALLFGACGGDDDSAPTATASATPGATESPAPTGTGTVPASATASPTVPAGVDPGAIETLVAYYRHLHAGEFADAYALWADDGAASGQSESEFTAEYEPVDGASLLIDSAEPAGDGTVMVEARVLLVREKEDGTQVANETTVEARLSDNAGTWVIQSIDASGVGELSEAPDDVDSPGTVLAALYAAINGGRLPAAYTYWSDIGNASTQAYTGFAAGFERTAGAVLTMGEPTTEGAAGTMFATVPAVVAATATTGEEQVFCGEYTVSRSNVPPFDLLGWRVYSASLSAVDGATPSDAQALLDNDCTLP